MERTKHGYVVRDANGIALAHVYCRDDLHASLWGDYQKHLTSDEARRIAKAVARIPEFLRTYPGFEKRQVERRGRYWRSSHPYHVALRDMYVREHYDEIDACCQHNGVLFDATGEKLEVRGTFWLTYEFERQFDAIRFWNKFDGPWMLGDSFIALQSPPDFQSMKSLKHKGAI